MQRFSISKQPADEAAGLPLPLCGVPLPQAFHGVSSHLSAIHIFLLLILFYAVLREMQQRKF